VVKLEEEKEECRGGRRVVRGIGWGGGCACVMGRRKGEKRRKRERKKERKGNGSCSPERGGKR
jgi:hypothetical protein